MYSFLRPLLFSLDAESAHLWTLRTVGLAGRTRLGRWLLHRAFAHEDERLAVEVFGLRFRNPIGLAAGYDKNGVAVGGFGAMGFGFVEVGTVTPDSQPGNPRPRIFRLPEDDALINRMGFPNSGVEALRRNLSRAARNGTRVGVNIGKGRETPLEAAAEEYATLFRRVHKLADYIAVNVSSPNTLGLRGLQSRAALTELLGGLVAARAEAAAESARAVPLALKISPDLSPAELDDVIDVSLGLGLDAIIATNTTLSRFGLRSRSRDEAGGLSGRPLRDRSTEVIRHIHQAVAGRLPVIGVGGIASAADALEKILAGASLVQVYTGLVFQGPGLVGEVARGLARAVQAHGTAEPAGLIGRET